MRRRSFLKAGAAAAGFVSSAATHALVTEIEKPRIHKYVPLGNTGMKISDISFGCSRLSDPQLVRYAFDRGVNYFDTAESYRGGASETAVGTALSDVRDQVIIASKTKARASHKRRQFMRALEESLKRLRTDYVDIYYNHAVNDVARLENPEWREFTDRAMEQGKIRFRGVSGHGSQLVECLDYAIDHQLADVILAAFNFAQDPEFEARLRHVFHYVALQPDLVRVLDKARASGTGVVVMKTLMGARLNDVRQFEKRNGTFSQAALRWVLASSRTDAALISMTDYAKIDEFLGASGTLEVSDSDFSVLAHYAALQSGHYCQHACSICADSCPDQVPISEILRVRMYDVDYRDPILARHDYSNLEISASQCLVCEHQACTGSCPNDIPIASYTRDAAQRLAVR